MARVTLIAALVALLAPATAQATTRVLAVGDFGVGGREERAIGASMKTWEAGHPGDTLLTLGDNDYTESPSAFTHNWNDAFGWRKVAPSIIG